MPVASSEATKSEKATSTTEPSASTIKKRNATANANTKESAAIRAQKMGKPGSKHPRFKREAPDTEKSAVKSASLKPSSCATKKVTSKEKEGCQPRKSTEAANTKKSAGANKATSSKKDATATKKSKSKEEMTRESYCKRCTHQLLDESHSSDGSFSDSFSSSSGSECECHSCHCCCQSRRCCSSRRCCH